jgi:hypothetical protein
MAGSYVLPSIRSFTYLTLPWQVRGCDNINAQDRHQQRA